MKVIKAVPSEAFATIDKKIMQWDIKNVFDCYVQLQANERKNWKIRPQIDQFAIVPSSTLSIQDQTMSGKILRIKLPRKNKNGDREGDLTLSYDTFETGPIPKEIDEAELDLSRTQRLGNLVLKKISNGGNRKITPHGQIDDVNEAQKSLELFVNWLATDIAESKANRTGCSKEITDKAKALKKVDSSAADEGTTLEKVFGYIMPKS